MLGQLNVFDLYLVTGAIVFVVYINVLGKTKTMCPSLAEGSSR